MIANTRHRVASILTPRSLCQNWTNSLKGQQADNHR